MRGQPQRAALAVVAALLVVTALGSWVARTRSPCAAGPTVIVLDPGHGGVDPGALNEAVGLVERDLTLVIAQRAATALRAEGYQVVLTRDDDATALGNSERGLMANSYGASVYVSIHLNSFTEPEPNYVTTFWAIAAKDQAFAEVMQAALAAELRPGTNLGDSGVAQLENGGLLRARMPATLVEAVFLSNPEEAARLAAGERLDQIARAIAQGVMDWVGSPCRAPRDTRGGIFLPPGDVRRPALAPGSALLLRHTVGQRSTGPWPDPGGPLLQASARPRARSHLLGWWRA